ncbi:MAG: hypothetical protein IKB07_12300 [Lachnospiraceae bacterium]|nr:hypothetical protein [Lachnospiraceae bacterium]
MKYEKKIEISSMTLHILAMVFMLCDHLWATVVPGNDWLTDIGRIAFPMFAFLFLPGTEVVALFRAVSMSVLHQCRDSERILL